MRREAHRLIQRRFDALAAGDFAALYASYHRDAPFIAQFPAESDYLDFAAENLAGIDLLQTHIGAVRRGEEGIEVICGLRFELGGREQVLFELALLVDDGEGLSYHSAQKLIAEEFSGGFDDLDFVHFDSQAVKIRF